MNESIAYLSIASLLIGVVARIFIPWLAKRQMDPEGAEWSWRYVWPQLLSVALVLMLMPLLIEDLFGVGGLPPQVAWLVGWGAADIGRETYKALASEADSE